MVPYLQIDGLTKSFGDLVLFNQISLGVAEGQRIGLIAKNGSGKTTLLNIIAGKEGYDEGSIVFRRDLCVGYLEQDPHYPEELTVLEACFHHGNTTVQLIKEYERCMETEGNPGLLPAEANTLDWKFITDVKNNIKNNIDNTDFTVDSLCSLHNMSRTSFYNKLKALSGQSPADYIRDFRLNTAAQLLQKKKYSITEVAEMTGFCDSKYFREVFKKHFNVSPSKYGKEDKK